MIPAFLAYISGTTLSDLNQKNGTKLVSINRTNVILNTVFFVLGFSIVFSTLGVIINSTLGGLSSELISGFNQIGGIIIIGFGIFLLLTTKFRSLNIEKKFFPKREKASYPLSFLFGLAFAAGWTPCVGPILGTILTSYPLSFLFGLAFAAGWTPCVGPILGTILTLAAATPTVSFYLLLAYSLGLGIPFILMGVFFSRATRVIQSMSKHLKYYSVIIGALIIFLGVLVFTNQLAYIANFPLLNELVLLG
jgi:cytochrome c-type biogenesis protein